MVPSKIEVSPLPKIHHAASPPLNSPINKPLLHQQPNPPFP